MGYAERQARGTARQATLLLATQVVLRTCLTVIVGMCATNCAV